MAGETYGFPLTVLFYGLTSLVFSLFFGGSLLDVLLGAVVAFYLLMEKEKIRGIAGELSRVLLGEKITKHAKNLFAQTTFSL